MSAIELQLNAPAAAAARFGAPVRSDCRLPLGPGGFDAALDSINEQAGRTEADARTAATQFVATAFVMPVLEMLRESPFAAEPFAPNAAQKRFGPMLDWQIADRVTGAANFPLVDSIVQRLMARSDSGAEHIKPERGVDVRA